MMPINTLLVNFVSVTSLKNICLNIKKTISSIALPTCFLPACFLSFLIHSLGSDYIRLIQIYDDVS